MMCRSLVVGVILLLAVTACSTAEQPETVATPFVPDMPRAAPHPTPWTDEVYETCRDAVRARVIYKLGAIGPGLGFAQATVPTAEDDDDDGIVCEVLPQPPAEQ